MRFDLKLPLVLFVLGAVALPSTPARAEPQYYPEWRDAFAVYADDPVAGGDLVIDLVRKGDTDLPPSALTVAGDAYLRRGNYGNARKMFMRALEDPTSNSLMGPAKAPISSHAELGLALAAVGAGKFADAQEWFAKVAVAGGDLGHLGMLGEAQSAIALGRYDEGLELLQSLNGAENVEEAVVDASRFATADALLAAGDFEAAAKAFQELADDSSGEAARDAAYGAALARKAAGDRDVALQALTSLLEACPKDDEANPDEEAEKPRPISHAERDLDPRAILQAWVRNYREQPPSAYQAGFSSAFPVHSCDLAVELIAVLESMPAAPAPAVAEPEPPAEEESVRVAAVEVQEPAEVGEPARPAPTAPPSQSRGPSGSGASLGMILVALAAVVLLGWLWRRGSR